MKQNPANPNVQVINLFPYALIFILLASAYLIFTTYFSEPQDLTGQTWLLDRVESKKIFREELWSADKAYDYKRNRLNQDRHRDSLSITFFGNRRFSARKGCNTVQGNWESNLKDGKIKLELGFQTLVGCVAFDGFKMNEGNYEKVGDAFKEALRTVETYWISNEELHLTFDKTQKVLVFTKYKITA